MQRRLVFPLLDQPEAVGAKGGVDGRGVPMPHRLVIEIIPVVDWREVLEEFFDIVVLGLFKPDIRVSGDVLQETLAVVHRVALPVEQCKRVRVLVDIAADFLRDCRSRVRSRHAVRTARLHDG